MRKEFILIAMSVLVGCSTYSDLRERPFDYSADTVKSPENYIECVLPKWLDFYAGTHMVTDGSSKVLVAPVGGGTPNVIAMTLTATPSNGGSHIEMKHMPSLGKYAEQWEKAQSCL